MTRTKIQAPKKPMATHQLSMPVRAMAPATPRKLAALQ
jgi:hypothetical protein